MTRNRNKGFCTVCDKEYVNLYQHNRTQRHKERASKHAIKQESSQDEPQDPIHDEPQDIKHDEEPITSTSDDHPNSVETPDPVSTVRIISGEGKKDREWIDKIIEQIVTPENIALAGAAIVAFLNSKTNPQQTTVGVNALTDLYGNVHDF